MIKGPVHYRLRDYASEDGVKVVVEKWFAVKETPQGYWIVQDWDYRPEANENGNWYIRPHIKWAPKTNPRAYSPVLKDAVLSFRNRKAVQYSKLKWQIQQVEQVERHLEILDDSTVTEAGFSCGMPPEWLGLRWE